jgi:DNA-directed RNA polymerase specialized sigma24 family protein
VVTKFDPETRETASVEEAAAQLATMSKADLIRLEQFARLRTAGLPVLDWEDLLHEAIDRILSGSRKWPKSIPFVAFMCGTMRSIASEFWRDRSTKQEITMTDLAPKRDSEANALDHIADEHPDPEREASARELLKTIRALFEDDADALAVLQGLAIGAAPKEILRNGDMTPKAYASAQKRIRRTIARAFREKKI